MSLHLTMNDARLTVFGYGWNDEVYDSGEGLTPEGEAWEDIAEELGYEIGDDIDWDDFAETYDPYIDNDPLIDDQGRPYYEDEDGIEYYDPDGDGIFTDDQGNPYPGEDGSFLDDMIYIDNDGVIYTDDDIDGIWTDEDGNEFPGWDVWHDEDGDEYIRNDDGSWTDESGVTYTDNGDGTWTGDDGSSVDHIGQWQGDDGEWYTGGGYLPESVYDDLADQLADSAAEDAEISPYSIPQETLNSLPVGGPVSQGGTGSNIHEYSPAANYYTQSGNSIIYTIGQLHHRPRGGSDYQVVEASFNVHGSQVQTAYFDNCQPLYSEVGGGNISDSLPEAYAGLSSSRDDSRHQYIVWQLCFGSFGTHMIIDPGGAGDKSDIPTVEHDDMKYYRFKDSQVRDRV